MVEQTQKRFALRFGLRTRLLLAFLFTVLAPTALFAIFSFKTITDGIDTLEKARLQESKQLALAAFRQQGEQIAANVQDYAHWDEMFEPATGRDPEWQRVNISLWIPNQFNIDVIWLADRDGNVYYEYHAPEEMKIKVSGLTLFERARRGEETYGIMETSEGLLLAATSYVSPALFSRPFDPAAESPAVLFYGRFIDHGVAEEIMATTGRHIEFFDQKSLLGTSIPERQELVSRSGNAITPELRPLGMAHEDYSFESALQDSIVTALYDVDNMHVGAMRIIQSIQIERFVREGLITTYAWSIIIVATIAIALSMFFGSRLATIIHSLSKQVQAYTRGDFHHPVSVTRSDEIGELQSSFATLIQTLEKAKVRLHEQEMTILDIIELNSKQRAAKAKKQQKQPPETKP